MMEFARLLERLSKKPRPTRQARRRPLLIDLGDAGGFGLEERILLSTSIPLSATNWSAMGPGPLSTGSTTGNVSGRIAGIATSPTDASTYYIAAAGGGVWKTTNAGTSWTPLTDGQATLSMGAIAVAPSDGNVIYAGTGEANNSLDSNSGMGVLKSTDGGTTWTLLTNGGIFNRVSIAKIAVDPTNANIAYVATNNFGFNGNYPGTMGIFKTTNGGTTWTNTSSSITTGDSYSDVVIDPTNPSTVYMAVGYMFGSSANGVYKSTNGGGSWSLLASIPSGTTVGRIALALAPSNTNVLYVSMVNPSSFGLLKMLRSDNGGTSFTDLTAGTPNYLGGQGWYDTTIAVSPTNSAEVYVGGASGSNSLLRSTNSGASWTSITSSAASPFTAPHVDHHAMAYDSGGRLLDGNDGGIYRLDVASPVAWTNLNANINTIQFQGTAVHPTDINKAAGGSQDNGTEIFNDNLTWTETDGGDGGVVRYNSTNPSILYHQIPNGSFGTNFVRVSTNGGASWSTQTSGISVDVNNQNFYAPLVTDPGNGFRVLYGTNRVWEGSVSVGGVITWTARSAVGSGGWNTGGAFVDTIAAAKTDVNTIYAAVGGSFASSSSLFVTTDRGTTWNARNLPAGSGRVNEIQVDPTNALTAYAVVNMYTTGAKHVWKTTNGGTSWTDISGNLPNLPTWTIQIDTRGTGTLYVGTDDGVYSSTNGGTTWSRFGTGLPRAQVFTLDLETGVNILGAGTHGRGMWEILVNAAAVSNVTSSVANGTYGVGAIIPITLTFNQAVNVTGTPTLALNSGGTATYASGSGTDTLTFNYTVAAGQNSADLDYTSINALNLNGGTIKDLPGNPATLTLPSPGAAGSLGANKNIVINTTVTTAVNNVSSTNVNGSYTVAAPIDITVSFTAIVTVTGTPQLALNTTGGPAGVANYLSGSGTSTLTFRYFVAAGQNSPDLDYASTSALTLNGGTIVDGSSIAANLTLPAPGAAGSLGANKNIVIDTLAPTVSNVTSTLANGTYGSGTVIPITVTFSEPVIVNNVPLLALNSGGTAIYASGSGTANLVFNYTVSSGQSSADLDYTSTSALTLNGGTIVDAASNPAVLTLASPGTAGSLGANKNIVIDGVAPTVTNVTSASSDGSYGTGTVIPITIIFSETVTVTGTPQLALNSGGTASYASGSGTSSLVFNYTVVAGQTSADLDYSSTGALTLNGGTIVDAGSNPAVLTLASPGAAGSLGANKNIVIDAVAPTVSNVTSTTANGTYGTGATIVITIAFSEPVAVTGAPSLALNSGGGAAANYVSGTGTTTLTFNYVVAAGQNSPDLDYTSTSALALNGGTIKDLVGTNPNNANLTLPAPGAAGSLGANKNIVINTVVLTTVTGVTSAVANSSYGTGATIDITVGFSAAVTVTGTPQLALNTTGGPAGVANYLSGSGTATLTFRYIVAAGQSSADLDYTSTSALALNGGTIVDGSSNAAVLTLPTPGTAGSLGANKNIVIDAVAPVVTSLSSSNVNGLYGTGAVLVITIGFNEPVTVAGGPPTLSLNTTGGVAGVATYTGGSGSSTLSFTYTVQPNQTTSGNRLDAASVAALVLNGGTITDGVVNSPNAANLAVPVAPTAGALAVNKNLVIDAVAPVVQAYKVLYGTNQSYNLTGSARTYLPWQITGVQVVFSKPIAAAGLASLTGLTTTGISGLNSNTLTWTISTITQGIFSTSLLGTGPSAIADAAGNTLTTVNQNFKVLYGDANDDGKVDIRDAQYVYAATAAAYNPFADLDGNGVVDSNDVLIARRRIGNFL